MITNVSIEYMFFAVFYVMFSDAAAKPAFKLMKLDPERCNFTGGL